MKDRRRLGSDELVEAFTEMSWNELSEFVKQFEEVFGVTAAAPVALAAEPAAGSDPAASTAPEEGEYYIAIASSGDKKINVIKEVRALTKLGLKESKELVESGGRVGAFAGQAAARRAVEALEGAGAVVVILGEGGGHRHLGSDLDRYGGNEELLQVVRARLGSMLSSAEVTRVLDAGEQTLKEWLEAPRSSDPTVGNRLTSLLQVAAGFTQMWDEDLFAGWLFAPNAHLDGATPADLIMLGKSSIVLMALDEAAFGIYA